MHIKPTGTWNMQNYAKANSFQFKVFLYFFGYKTELFSFQNNPKGLDLSLEKAL